MKLAIRVLTLSVVFAGIAVASVSSLVIKAKPSRQPATKSLPVSGCVPGFSACLNSTVGQ